MSAWQESPRTRIDIHSNVSDPFQYAVRLVRKAYRSQHGVIVVIENQIQLEQFDRFLWEFSATDFLPHVIVQNVEPSVPQDTPILLTSSLEIAPREQNALQEILINLGFQVPHHFMQFARVIDIVSTDAQAVDAGRKRYRFYQQQNHQPHHIQAQ